MVGTGAPMVVLFAATRVAGLRRCDRHGARHHMHQTAECARGDTDLGGGAATSCGCVHRHAGWRGAGGNCARGEGPVRVIVMPASAPPSNEGTVEVA